MGNIHCSYKFLYSYLQKPINLQVISYMGIIPTFSTRGNHFQTNSHIQVTFVRINDIQIYFFLANLHGDICKTEVQKALSFMGRTAKNNFWGRWIWARFWKFEYESIRNIYCIIFLQLNFNLNTLRA